MDESIKNGQVDFWRDDLGFGKADGRSGEKVFLHRNQFKVRDGPRWISANPPIEIVHGSPVVFTTKDGLQGRRATKWALVSEREEK